MSILLEPDAGDPTVLRNLQIQHLELPTIDSPGLIAPESEEHGSFGPKLAAVAEIGRREQIYRQGLACADSCAFVAAALLACVLENRQPTWPMCFLPAFVVLLAKIEGMYDRDDQVIAKASVGEWRSILRTAAIGSIAVYLSQGVLTTADGDGGMRVYLLLVVSAFIFSVAARAIARRAARRISEPERCVIIGDRVRASDLATRLDDIPGVELVGVLANGMLTGSVAELTAVVDQLGVHRLIIAPASETGQAEVFHLIQAAKLIGVRVSLQPSVMTAVGGFALFEEFDGMTLLGVPRFGLSRSSRAVKRGFDLLVGTIALILLSPAIGAIAIAVRLDSPGPVLFRQTRIGRGGTPFRILKFRSMVDGADAMKAQLMAQNEASGGLFKIVGDPRITRVGRLIRSTHLDELPQLLNVLKGEMSLVGPRPLVLEEDSLFTGRDRHRLRLTPGMTGPWQVKGPMHTPLSEMAMLDYRYASHWSIWGDFDILIKTVLRVLSRGGH